MTCTQNLSHRKWTGFIVLFSQIFIDKQIFYFKECKMSLLKRWKQGQFLLFLSFLLVPE